MARQEKAKVAAVPEDKVAPIKEVKCSKCGQVVSGPDPKAVSGAMARHKAKAH